MKVNLERTLSTCPPQIKCVACAQPFKVGKIRSLLCDRTHLIQGDLCDRCLNLTETALQQKLQTTEAIQRPSVYAKWFKRLTILAEATQEIEKARWGSAMCGCQRAGRLRIQFLPDINDQD